MRHDAHYVDELETRRPALPTASVPALAFPTSIPVTFALRDMSQELEGVASCFNLVSARARPLRERMGLSLARVGVGRNVRAFQALRVLLEDPPPERTLISLTSNLEQAVTSFNEELRLTNSRITLEVPDAIVRITADPRMVSLALHACAGMLVSLVQASNAQGRITSRRVHQTGWHRARCGRMSIASQQISSLAWPNSNGPSGPAEFPQASDSQRRPASRRPTAAVSMRGGLRRVAARCG